MALLADTPVALPVSAPQDAYNNYEQRPLHSPPQATPSSYGNAMPKRARAGSVSRSRTNSVDLSLSSRLRSASELEKAGVVSSTQKGAPTCRTFQRRKVSLDSVFQKLGPAKPMKQSTAFHH